MKIVIFSDIHFHEWREFSKVLPTGRNSRFQDQLNVLDRIFEYSAAKQIDLIVFLGDLFESIGISISKNVFLTVFDIIRAYQDKFGIPLRLVVGNHDWIDKTETKTIVEPFNELQLVKVISNIEKVDLDNNISLVFCPFRRNFAELVDKILVNDKKTILFTHQELKGAVVGSHELDLGIGVDVEKLKKFWWVFNGHYHKRQRVGKNVLIVGSPLQRDFGDRGEVKGFYVLDIKNEELNFIEIDAPKFFKIDMTVGEAIPENYRKGKDFLWLITKPSYLEKGDIEGEYIRIEAVAENKIERRSEISYMDSVNEMLRKYVDVANTEGLNKSKLVKMGLEWYKEVSETTK